jgi:hypothetical protein
VTAYRGVSSVRLFHFASALFFPLFLFFPAFPFFPSSPSSFPRPFPPPPPLGGPPPPFPPRAPALRVECTVLLVAQLWFALPFFRNAALQQGRQFGSVPVSRSAPRVVSSVWLFPFARGSRSPQTRMLCPKPHSSNLTSQPFFIFYFFCIFIYE